MFVLLVTELTWKVWCHSFGLAGSALWHSRYRFIVFHILLHRCWSEETFARIDANISWSTDTTNWRVRKRWWKIIPIRKTWMAHEEIRQIWIRFVLILTLYKIATTKIVKFLLFDLFSLSRSVCLHFLLLLYWHANRIICLFRYGVDHATRNMLQVKWFSWCTNRTRWNGFEWYRQIYVAIASKSSVQEANGRCSAWFPTAGLFLIGHDFRKKPCTKYDKTIKRI